MELIRWQPAELTHARHDLDRFFDNFWTNSSAPAVRSWSPNVDISESSDGYTLTAELPGVAKQDVHVTVVEGRLTLRGEKKQETQEEKENTHRVERTYGSFTRSFDLPQAVNAEKITASFKNGVLSIGVPKAEEAKPKQIEISVN